MVLSLHLHHLRMLSVPVVAKIARLGKFEQVFWCVQLASAVLHNAGALPGEFEQEIERQLHAGPHTASIQDDFALYWPRLPPLPVASETVQTADPTGGADPARRAA